MGNRIFVGNLSFDTTDDGLREAFSAYGEVTDVKVMMDRDTGRPRGFGFVSMSTSDEAEKAIQSMEGSMLDGRAIRVNEAEERRPPSGGGFGGGGGGRGGRGGGRGGRGGGGGGNRW